MTSRGPLTLAALASAAVPGLDPDTVEGVVPTGPGDPFDVALVSDQEHRRWVIRCPVSPAASAHLERSAALLGLLARRLTMPVPAVKGWVALPEGGRAAVHSYLTGRMVSLAGVTAGSALATGLGRAIAQLHNLDVRVYEEAGVPVYDAASYRSRRLAELDRAAATGRVPTGLLTRWEKVLDDESLWTFTSTPTHGALGDDTVLATPDDGNDVDVKAFLGWESAQVADPADDLAPILAELDPEAVDTVMEAYAHARVERPDRHLQQRAKVIGEMQLVRAMMTAVAAGDDEGAEEHAMHLRRLDDRLAREEEAAGQATPAPAPAAVAAASEPDAEDTPAKADTQPVETQPPAETGSVEAQPADDRPADTQPVATGPVAVPDASDESDEAVQVEHPAEPTPVQPAQEPTDEAAAETPAAEAPEEQADEDLPSPAEPTTDKAPDDAPAAIPAKGSDHITDEITPIADEDDDDVVPPTQRS